MSVVGNVRSLLEEDQRLTIRQIAMHEEMCNPISHATVYRIVCDGLAMKKVSSWWVPKQLTETHRNECMTSVINFLTRCEQEGNAMLKRIVTGYETQIHHYTPSTKKQTMV